MEHHLEGQSTLSYQHFSVQHSLIVTEDFKRNIYRAHKTVQINGTPDQCDEENLQKQENCINEYAMTQLGCHLPWIDQEMTSTHRRLCDKPKDLDTYIDVIQSLMTQKGKKEIISFGCHLPNCKKIEWEVLRTENYGAFGSKVDNAVLMMQFSKADCMKTTMYHLVYGFSNFVADFGGYLGLLLGASLLSIYDTWVEYMMLYFRTLN